MSESITKELRDCIFDCQHLKGVADRIDERFSRELTAKQDEVDALRAKLDASILPHVASEPHETIEDVRKAKDNAIVYLAQSGVMGWTDLNTFSSDFAQVFDRAYACGRRDGAGERA